MDTPPQSKPAGHGAKFTRKKEQALASLVACRTVEEAAESAGLSAQTLYRWMKIPEFAKAYREAREANVVQAFARLQQASGTAVTLLLKVMHNPKAPRPARLRAADRVLSCVKGTSRFEEIGARLMDLQQRRQTSRAERCLKSGEAAVVAQSRARQPGHGGRFTRKKEEAVTALLTKRSVEEAARHAGIATSTLYRWMLDAEFAAEYRLARLAAFGQAGARLQQAAGPATATIFAIMADPQTPPATLVQACDLLFKHATGQSQEDVSTTVTDLNRARRGAASLARGGDRRIFDEIARQRSKAPA